MIAAIVDKVRGGLFADAAQRHQVTDHVLDHDLFVIAVDLLSIDLILRVHKRGGDILVDSVDIGVVVDIALVVHLAQDGFLSLLVGDFVKEGVVGCRLVRDTDDRCALGQCQIPDILVKIAVGRCLNAPGTLAEIDGVEVPFDDLFLIITLFQLKRTENLAQFALDRDLFLARQVFDELLGDRRAAIGIVVGEELQKSAACTVPVHALVLVKALILNGDKGLLHIPGNVVIVDPLAVLAGGQGGHLLPVAVAVLIVDRAGLCQLIVVERERDRGGQLGFDVVGKDQRKQQPRDQKDQQQRAEKLENGADRTGDGIDRAAHQKTGNANALRRTFFLFPSGFGLALGLRLRRARRRRLFTGIGITHAGEHLLAGTEEIRGSISQSARKSILLYDTGIITQSVKYR